jgi:hypothetical protein
VDATNAASHAQNEAKLTRDKLKRAQAETETIREQLARAEAEKQESRNEHYQMLHKNKADAIRVQEQLNLQLKALEKEKASLESQVMGLL